MAGTNFFAPLTTVADAALTNESGLVVFAKCTGVPATTANVYAPGGLIMRTDVPTLYQNTGTAVSPTWTAVGTGADVTLSDITVTNNQSALDNNGNEWLSASVVTNAVNNVVIGNGATNQPAVIRAVGTDTNVTLGLTGQGTGIVSLGQPGTGTVAGGSVTINAQKGVVTTDNYTTTASQVTNFTLTNNKITASSVMLATLQPGTNITGVPILFVTPASGSATVGILNAGQAAMNGNLKIHFTLV